MRLSRGNKRGGVEWGKVRLSGGNKRGGVNWGE